MRSSPVRTFPRASDGSSLLSTAKSATTVRDGVVTRRLKAVVVPVKTTVRSV